MPSLRRLTVAEQAAAHLREGLRRGRWAGSLPGVARLAGELGVSTNTVQAALRMLESEGLLGVHGRGRSRTIHLGESAETKLRVGILLYDATLEEAPQTARLLSQIQHDLAAAGHEVFCAAKSQVALRHNVKHIAAHLHETPAHVWIVESGSRPLLEWFAGQAKPCLALFGRTDGLPIARTGPDKVGAYAAATRCLLGLGHRRIALICRRLRRTPKPGNIEQAFLNELAAGGLPTGGYCLPDWEETPGGFHALLESLFRTTPPTALIIDETCFFHAATAYFARRGIRVPADVSMVATDYDASFYWHHPPVAGMRWENAPIIRRIVRWVEAARKGRADRETINFPTQFVHGETIGPARPGWERDSSTIFT